MTNDSAVTESVVNTHLKAFLERKGIAAIVADFAEHARLLTEARIYRGKDKIHEFYVDFIASLPADAIERFSPLSMQVDGDVAIITWHVGSDIPLGTDTFVVNDGKIVTQTFVMHAAAA